MKRVLVTGSRVWKDEEVIYRALEAELGEHSQGIVVHGACPTGADSLAQLWVNLQPGITAERHPAEWDKHGKSAGFKRNKVMADLGADVCLAFPLGESRGTRMMMALARGAGIPVLSFEGASFQ